MHMLKKFSHTRVSKCREIYMSIPKIYGQTVAQIFVLGTHWNRPVRVGSSGCQQQNFG